MNWHAISYINLGLQHPHFRATQLLQNGVIMTKTVTVSNIYINSCLIKLEKCTEMSSPQKNSGWLGHLMERSDSDTVVV